MMMMMMLKKTIMFKILNEQHTPYYYFTYGDVFTLIVFVPTRRYFTFTYLIPSLPAGYAKDFEDIFALFPGLVYERIIQ
jgi:hypothetical protein